MGVVVGAMVLAAPAVAAPPGWEQVRLGIQEHASNADLAVDRSGNLWVAWTHNTVVHHSALVSERLHEVRAQRIRRDGTVEDQQVVFAGPGVTRHLDLAVAPDGGAVVGWYAEGAVRAARARPDEPFGAPVTLTEHANGWGTPWVAAADGGAAAVLTQLQLPGATPDDPQTAHCRVWRADGPEVFHDLPDPITDEGSVFCGGLGMDGAGTVALTAVTREHSWVARVRRDGTTHVEPLTGIVGSSSLVRVAPNGFAAVLAGGTEGARLFRASPGTPLTYFGGTSGMWLDLALDDRGHAATIAWASLPDRIKVTTDDGRGDFVTHVIPVDRPTGALAIRHAPGSGLVAVWSANSDGRTRPWVADGHVGEGSTWEVQALADGGHTVAMDATPDGTLTAVAVWPDRRDDPALDDALEVLVRRRSAAPPGEEASPRATGVPTPSLAAAVRGADPVGRTASPARAGVTLASQRLSTVLRRGWLRARCAGPAGATCTLRAMTTARVARELRSPRRTLATRTVGLGDDGRATVRLRLSPAIRKAMARRRGVEVRVRARVASSTGPAVTTTARRVLRG